MDKRAAILDSGFRVAVLCGGIGSERDVSLVSGKAVETALVGMGLPCDLLDLKSEALPDSLSPGKHLVLPIVHGTYGEDGRLSAELERGGYAYAGCDMASSVLCFDKVACKAVAVREGVPVATDCLLRAGEHYTFDDLSSRLGLPMILKPRLDGSSVGLHLIREQKDFDQLARDLSIRDYLAESFLEGIDLTVGMLDGKPLGVVAVHPEGGLYDYAHKYTSGLSRYEVPAKVSDSVASRLKDWSARAFSACRCRDLARVDFRMGVGEKLIFLEINTLPGMTPTSLLPKSASCEGYSFESLVLEWVGFAFARSQERMTA